MKVKDSAAKQRRDAHQYDRKTKTAVNGETVRRLGAHAGTHKSTNQSIANGQRKSNENFPHAPCVSAAEVYNNTGGMN